MGAKFSKSSKGEKKWDDMKVNGKSLPENFDKTSTLPASFRRRDEEVVMTGTLPRNLNRNQSFSKRFRKSCKNWAAQRGLIDPCKANQTETQSQVPTKPSSVVLAQEECKDKITDVAQELPEVVITKAQSLDMLVESNSMPTVSADKIGQETASEVEAHSNSAEAEIVIEASTQDIEKSDTVVNDCELTKSSESEGLNPDTDKESTIVEKVEVISEASDSIITDKEEHAEPSVLPGEVTIDEQSSQAIVDDKEPVVEINESETTKVEGEIHTDKEIDTGNDPSMENLEIITTQEDAPIVEAVQVVLEDKTEKVIENVTETCSNAEGVNEGKTSSVEVEEIHTEVKQEVINTDIVPPTELQTENPSIMHDEVPCEEIVQEVDTVSEKTSLEETEKPAESSFITEGEKEVNITQEESQVEYLTTESVTEEKVVNEIALPCLIGGNQEVNEITEEIPEKNESSTALVENVTKSEEEAQGKEEEEKEGEEKETMVITETKLIENIALPCLIGGNNEENEITEEMPEENVTKSEEEAQDKEEEEKEAIVIIETKGELIQEIALPCLIGIGGNHEENEIMEEIPEKVESSTVLVENVTKSEEEAQDKVEETKEIIDAGKLIQEGTVIEEDTANDTQQLSLVDDSTDNKIESTENDQSKPSAVTDEDSFNAGVISTTESEQKIVNENEDKVIEDAENIEVTKSTSDNLVDTEEKIHEVVIIDGDKSKKAIEEEENNLVISADKCNEQDNHIEEKDSEQEEDNSADCDKKKDQIEDDMICEDSCETVETTLSNISEDNPCETETESDNLVKREDTELVSEEIEKIEIVSTDVITASDGTWKCQWDLPCLASQPNEANVAVEMTNEGSTEKSEIPQEVSNEGELDTMNEALDSSNTAIQSTEDKIESLSETESKEEINECEPENEKKTEAVNDELDTPECDSTTQFEGESNISLPELEVVEMKTENTELENAEPSSLESLEDEKDAPETVINKENKHVETVMKDIITDIVDNIASKSEITSLETVSDAPADDLISEGGSDGCVSTDEGIAASDDDDKDSCKSDELKKDNAKELAESEIETIITEIDQHP